MNKKILIIVIVAISVMVMAVYLLPNNYKTASNQIPNTTEISNQTAMLERGNVVQSDQDSSSLHVYHNWW